MARMRSLLVATATIAALAAPTTASAATADCDGLQAALDNSVENEVVTLDEGAVCQRHYDLPSHQITLEGGGETGATLSGVSKGNFQILSGSDVGATTIRNLTFVDGDEDEGDGGAIRVTGFSPVTLEDNTFADNDASDNGGAVSITNFQVFTPARGEVPPIVLRDNTFSDNESGDGGGGAYISAFFNDVVVEDNTFEGNRTGAEDQEDGGGLLIDAAQDVTLAGNVFTTNEATLNGGGAAVNTCRATVDDNHFDGNTVDDQIGESSIHGGGLYLANRCGDLAEVNRGTSAPNVVQSGNLFTNNGLSGIFTAADGGGEYIDGLTALSTNDRFVGNAITDVFFGAGGGLAYRGFGANAFTARNLVATGNSVSIQTNQENRGADFVPGFGGGLAMYGQDSEFRIEDSTITRNTAPQGSGIAGSTAVPGASATRTTFQTDKLVLQNAIVHGNLGASDSPESDSDGEVLGFFEREISFTDLCVDGAPSEDGTGNICADPQLTDPDGEGNVDQKSSSPTRNKGDSSLVDADLKTDYKGDARVLEGRVDMGADEFKPAPKPEPEPEPGTPPASQPPAAAPPAPAVQGVQQRSCKSRRAFRIRIRVPRGKKAISATVRVNGKKVRVVRGKRLRSSVRLTGLPRGRFTVRITLRLANGKKVTGVRRYRTCIPKRPGDGPPKV